MSKYVFEMKAFVDDRVKRVYWVNDDLKVGLACAGLVGEYTKADLEDFEEETKDKSIEEVIEDYVENGPFCDEVCIIWLKVNGEEVCSNEDAKKELEHEIEQGDGDYQNDWKIDKLETM